MDTSEAIRRAIVVGDVHGAMDGLREILLAADLIDETDQWAGGETNLVQVGDMVDRGPNARDCLRFLHDLRPAAQQTGGNVTLLLGNHEMSLIQGDYRLFDDYDPIGLAERLHAEALQGQWKGAAAVNQFLITHAGVHPLLLLNLVRELHERGEPGPVSIRALVDRINAIVADAITNHDYAHDVFSVGGSRGGPHPYGGIFWADFDAEHALNSSAGITIRQIFGHTPPIRENDTAFRCTPDKMCINVDTGICPYYGGTLGYLEMTPDHVTAVTLGEDGRRQTLLGPEDLDRDFEQGQEIFIT